MRHAEQAAGDIAGLDGYLAAVPVVPDGTHPVVEAPGDGTVLASAPRRQFAHHVDMIVVNGIHGRPEFLPQRGQDARHPGGIHIIERLLCRTAGAAPGSMLAVVADIERLVAPRDGGRHAGKVFIGMVHAGGAVGILADQGCVVALSRQRSAAEQQHACHDEQAERD